VTEPTAWTAVQDESGVEEILHPTVCLCEAAADTAAAAFAMTSALRRAAKALALKDVATGMRRCDLCFALSSSPR